MTRTDETANAADSVVDGCDSPDQPDYSAVDIPAKPPSEFSYTERRAELLEQVYNLGHPSMIHQGEAAERYGVSQQQISKDLDRLGQHIHHEHLADRDRRALIVDGVVSRAIEGLLADEDWRQAARTAFEYDEFCREHVDLDRLDARIAQLESRLGGRR